MNKVLAAPKLLIKKKFVKIKVNIWLSIVTIYLAVQSDRLHFSFGTTNAYVGDDLGRLLGLALTYQLILFVLPAVAHQVNARWRTEKPFSNKFFI